jgi:hypothetical protein
MKRPVIALTLLVALAGCGPAPFTHVSAPSDRLVKAMGARAQLLARTGRKPTAIYGKVKGAAATSITLSWSRPPERSIPAPMLLDSAYVQFGDRHGIEALSTWCKSVDGDQTPVLCMRAATEAAQGILTP